MVKTKVWKIARGSPCTNNLESLCGKYNKTGAFINWMHSTDKLIANLTQNDIEAISNRVFKNKVTHSEKKNLENKKKMEAGTHAQIWNCKIDMKLWPPTSKNYHTRISPDFGLQHLRIKRSIIFCFVK